MVIARVVSPFHSVAMDARRRNGLLASCDPCRQRKIGCDHRKPTCKRCERRGQTSRCVYRSTPLTRNGSSDSTTQRSLIRPNISPLPPQSNAVEAQSKATPAVQALPPLTDTGLCVQQVKDILRQLKHFSRIETLLRDYYALSQGPIVPGPVLFAVLEAARISTALWQAVDQVDTDDSLLLSEAANIMSTTSSALSISSSTSTSDFCSMLCDEHIRLEALGIIYSVAARACKFIARRKDSSHESFINSLYVNSLECRKIARHVAPMNDALVWLTYENVILTTYMHGDSSEYALCPQFGSC